MVDEYHLPVEVIGSLVEGLMDDQAEEVLIEDEEDLIQYAYKVAGTVGLLMCCVLNTSNPKARPHAVDLGIAMQLTNIARDVIVDAKMGRRYLPGSWVNNMTPEQILAAADNPKGEDAALISSAVRRLLSLAEEYYASGRVGLSYLPARAHFAIGVATRYTDKSEFNYCVQSTCGGARNRLLQRQVKHSARLGASLGMFRRFPHPRGNHNTNLHTFLKPYKNQGGTWG